VAGFTHPLTGMDHLAAMVAVGLWSALAARRAWPDLLWAPLAFAGMLLMGALMGLAGLQLPAVEPMIAASLLVLGLLVVTRIHLPVGVALSVAGLFAVFHGVAHGQELAGEQGAALTLAGMAAATVLLHAAGIAIGWALRHANAWLPRVAGAGVVALGMTLLAQAA
jgi:urease accessory protein